MTTYTTAIKPLSSSLVVDTIKIRFMLPIAEIHDRLEPYGIKLKAIGSYLYAGNVMLEDNQTLLIIKEN